MWVFAPFLDMWEQGGTQKIQQASLAVKRRTRGRLPWLFDRLGGGKASADACGQIWEGIGTSGTPADGFGHLRVPQTLML